MNRKGVAYTMVAVLLMIIVATIFFTQQRVSQRDLQEATQARILAVDSFIENLESDSKRAAYIAGYRTLIAMEQEVTSSGKYISDVDSTFKEIFLTGNHSGSQFQVMLNSSFDEYILKVKSEVAKQGIDFNATVSQVRVWQVEPWSIRVNFTLAMNVSDARGTARWETDREFTGIIPVEEIRDPVFTKETLGRVQRVIRKTNVTQFVDDAGDQNDTTQLVWHFNESRYSAQERGPSVLMRFAGNLSDSKFGIESLVDTDDIDAQGVVTYPLRSVVDYEYFKGTIADACNVQNVPSYLKLDDESLDEYEVEGKLEYSSC